MFYTVTLNPALDLFIDAPDFSPGVVNSATGFYRSSGGKGANVARVLHSLGAPCVAAGICCGSAGDSFLSGLDELGIAHAFVRGPGETRTNVKITDRKTGETTDVNQPGPVIGKESLDGLFALLASRLQPRDTVALCGSLPLGVPAGIYAEWIRAFQAMGATVAMDASKDALRLGLAARPTVVKPNIAELSEILGSEIADSASALGECGKLIDSGVGLIALSMGGAGALFVGKGEHAFVPGLRVEVRSTTGAGDSMLAALLFALNRGDSLSDAGAFAVAVSAAQVSTQPGELPDGARIQALFAQAKQGMAGADLRRAFSGERC